MMIIFEILTLATAVISAMGALVDKKDKKDYLWTLSVSGVLFIIAYIADSIIKFLG